MKPADHMYAEVTRALLYVALVALATSLIIHATLNPGALEELSKIINGELNIWAPQTLVDYVPLYAIYFINLIVPIGLMYVLPPLFKENKPVAILTVIILILLALTISGIIVVKE